MLKLYYAVVAAALMLPAIVKSAPIGDWITGATDDGQLYAGSVNDSGGTLMKACRPSAGVCYWYLVTATSCEKGAASPALFSTSMGAISFQLTCDTAISQNGKTMYREQIGNPDGMDSLLSSTMPLGIAVALLDGRFAVYRFSMSGAKQAVTILMQGAAKISNSPKQSTRDSSL